MFESASIQLNTASSSVKAWQAQSILFCGLADSCEIQVCKATQIEHGRALSDGWSVHPKEMPRAISPEAAASGYANPATPGWLDLGGKQKRIKSLISNR